MIIATSYSQDRFYVWVDLYTYTMDLDIRHYPLDNSPCTRHCPTKNQIHSNQILIHRAAGIVKR